MRRCAHARAHGRSGALAAKQQDIVWTKRDVGVQLAPRLAKPSATRSLIYTCC